MSTDTEPGPTDTEPDHTEALEVIDHQIRFLTGELGPHLSPGIHDRLQRRLAKLKHSRAVLDGSSVPAYIADLGDRLANEDRPRLRVRQPIPDRRERARLCAVPVTLNGYPARITGIYKDYATVTDTVSGLSAQWAWPTAVRVVANGGHFSS